MSAASVALRADAAPDVSFPLVLGLAAYALVWLLLATATWQWA